MNSKLFKFILTAAFIFAGSQALANDDVLPQGQDKTALDLQRVALEETLKAKIVGSVVPIIPDTRFNLTVAINYKIYDAKKQAVQGEGGSYIELGKLGVVAPTVSEEVLKTDLISKIGYIRFTFIFYDSVDADKIKVIKEITKKVADVVPVWRMKIDMVLPPEGSGNTMKITKPLNVNFSYLWFLITGALVATFLFWFKKIQSEIQAVRDVLKERRRQPDSEHQTARDSSASHADYQRPQHSPNEQPQPSEEPEYSRADQVEEVMRSNSERVVTPVEREVQEPEFVPLEDVQQAIERLATSLPENEELIFEAIAKLGDESDLEMAAKNHFPAALVLELPGEIHSTTLGLFGIHQTTALMISLSDEERQVLMESASPKLRMYLDHEIENFSRDPEAVVKIRSNRHQYWAEYVKLIRQLLRSNEHLLHQVRHLLRAWMKKKMRNKRDAA